MKAFYCAGTHWDREWYEPFQEYRMWLVELIDGLLDLLDSDPDYRCFHLDGQAIVVQDYLDIRPDQKDRLLEHLRNGRILAGPWHVLPDEWLISSESYIRNIMKGMRTCRSLGFEPMDFAYTPDQFGHVAALPMIMTGFGLKTGIVSAMVDYPIGELIAERVRAMGVKPFYKHFKHDGVHGPNMATVFSDRGQGMRAWSPTGSRITAATTPFSPTCVVIGSNAAGRRRTLRST